MLEFLTPLAFAFLPLPLLVYWLLPRAERQQAALRAPLLERVAAASGNTAGQSPTSPGLRRIAAMTGLWVLLVIGAAQPVWYGDPVPIPNIGRDLMLAVDVSESMAEQDASLEGRRVDRLKAVQHAATDFIERREGDRVGLILFGEQAYLQTPLTYDRKTVMQMLNEAVVGIAGGRTAIGDAIGLATKRMEALESEDRVLILLTDGANTAGRIRPRQAANLAEQLGVRIHTIAFGSEPRRGGLFVSGGASIDIALLEDVATLTRGHFFRARNTDELEAIYGLIDKLEPTAGVAREVRPQHSLFHWPLATALLWTVLWLLKATGPNWPLRRIRSPANNPANAAQTGSVST